MFTDSLIRIETDTLSQIDTTVIYELPKGWANDWESIK